ANPGARRLDTRPGNSVRDVVELQVEEDLRAVPVDHPHDLGTRVQEELLADLEDAHRLAQQLDQPFRLGQRLDVEGEDETVTDGIGARWQERPARSHRGPPGAAARAQASTAGTAAAQCTR